ncbi:MAG: hypothetical protein R3C18_17510 [Planctomycetaceae bacterium]
MSSVKGVTGRSGDLTTNQSRKIAQHRHDVVGEVPEDEFTGPTDLTEDNFHQFSPK